MEKKRNITRRLPRLPTTVAAIFVLSALSENSEATILRPESIPALTKRADLVVRGRVVAATGRWRGGRIYTKVRIRVRNRWLCGSSSPSGTSICTGKELDFWTMGGRVGRIEQKVFGSPRFKPGNEVVLFLSKRRGGLFVTGMTQGAFLVTKSGTGTWAIRRLGSVRWVGRRPPARFRLDRLKALVRQAATSRGRQSP